MMLSLFFQQKYSMELKTIVTFTDDIILYKVVYQFWNHVKKNRKAPVD